MKKSALMLFLTLLPFMAKAQNTQNSEDGKKIDKEKLESKDYRYALKIPIESELVYNKIPQNPGWN